MLKEVNVVGAGLAGSECAYQLSKRGYKVKLYEMKPNKKSPAHKLDGFCELVCSNSLKSNLLTNACGLLKEELRILDSLVIKTADCCSVPAGNALAVDREIFSKKITDALKADPNIEIIEEEVCSLLDGTTVIATGPLTSDALFDAIREKIPQFLHFYDAVAPIVSFESIDLNEAFFGARYGKGGDDYLNCPMTKDQYLAFYDAIINAETVNLREFEKGDIFEGCMPIEIMAKKGIDTMRFGPLKPVGFGKRGDDIYALLQLRAENAQKTLFNLVGFQTNLTFKEQKRVFSMIPALKNADFVRYGVMHRNTYLDAPKTLDYGCRLKGSSNIFFAGQITGVEGYVESVMSGLYAAMQIESLDKFGKMFSVDSKTVFGALVNYLIAENKDFAPMNANFGIVDYQSPQKKLSKIEKYSAISKIALEKIHSFGKETKE
ncbi:MAG: methylenetetrahydrofolate--tRNA-(uracil(54)-C(5))-methyltransferase (FADH(2)-oxidizing) TrmFO [Clostridia bacterium]|nr:methylenetetrahydrofolate--tRNA-(uracil(54)-C(5))-methyltransferase (FADH(2)-oxidizing) TrmFO [Clostridia bacterium]